MDRPRGIEGAWRPPAKTPARDALRAPGVRGAARACTLAALAGVVVLAAVWLPGQRIRPVVAGYPAPNFEVTDAEGAPVTLDGYDGLVVLVNVWATWCAPCREEMPSMQRLYDRFSRDDFEIAAISVDAPPRHVDARGNPGGDPIAFARELGLTFPILLDPAGRIRKAYRTSGIPESFLIGRDGIVYKKVAGPEVWDARTNVDLVRRLVEGR